MKDNDSKYPVIIVGGGPVGLLLGILLTQADIACRILEQRVTPTSDSRSFGIHPPSLELLASVGLADTLIQDGCRIRQGHAFSDTKKIGSLSFDSYPGPYSFVLSLPQNRTERLLEQHLHTLNDQVLLRGAEVVDISEKKDGVIVTYRKGQQPEALKTDYLVGCDGKTSLIRKFAGIAFEGKKYPDTYVMGDFTDNTPFGNDAAIYLCEDGVVESFPLPENRRRWVVKTTRYVNSNQRPVIEQIVKKRTNHNLSKAPHTMVSSFGVQKYVAQSMVKDRIILAGDAAHIVSPIGGQGMNLGWLGARDLAHRLTQIIKHEAASQKILHSFERRRKKAAANAIRRSELNMRLGRSTSHPSLRNGLVSLILTPPLSKLMAQLFAMRGVERWIT